VAGDINVIVFCSWSKLARPPTLLASMTQVSQTHSL